MAQVVLRNPACHNTARSNKPSTRMMSRNSRTDSHANKPPLGRGSRRWGKARPILRPVQVDDVILLAAGEDHAPAKRICALRINQAGFKHPFQRVAEALQVSAQIAAASIANPEFCDELGIMHAAPGQVIHAFAMAV